MAPLPVAVGAQLKSWGTKLLLAPLTKWLDNRNATLQLQKAWAEERDLWFLEVLEALKRQDAKLAEQAKKDPKVERALQALVEDQQFGRLHRNYEFEAAREAMDERRSMLACASAGSFNAELSLAEIARIERVLRELDPAGVKLLNNIAKAVEIDEQGGFPFDPGIHEEHQAFDSLLTSGCVRIEMARVGDHEIEQAMPFALGTSARRDPKRLVRIPKMSRQAFVTSTGYNVLRVLNPYFEGPASPAQEANDKPDEA